MHATRSDEQWPGDQKPLKESDYDKGTNKENPYSNLVSWAV